MTGAAEPSAPAELELVVPPGRVTLMLRYADWLAGAGVERGLIGPGEAPRLWERHLLNCVAVSAAVPAAASVADLGSGAGLPGLVLAICRPDIAVTLVEPLLRRTAFLDEVVADLCLADQVRIVRARAEELHGQQVFDVVTGRAVAPLSRLLGWAMPLVAPGGELVAMKGASASDEVRDACVVARRLRCGEPRVEVLTAPDGSSTATVVRVAPADPPRVS